LNYDDSILLGKLISLFIVVKSLVKFKSCDCDTQGVPSTKIAVRGILCKCSCKEQAGFRLQLVRVAQTGHAKIETKRRRS
jgi:hypothetical protein